MWYLIVSTPDLCTLTYFVDGNTDLWLQKQGLWDVAPTSTGRSYSPDSNQPPSVAPRTRVGCFTTREGLFCSIHAHSSSNTNRQFFRYRRVDWFSPFNSLSAYYMRSGSGALSTRGTNLIAEFRYLYGVDTGNQSKSN